MDKLENANFLLSSCYIILSAWNSPFDSTHFSNNKINLLCSFSDISLLE